MKKNYFFIAAMAIGMMSSCTNNEILEEAVLPSLPDQVVDDGTTRMAIELGISDPMLTVSTRGTGVVGDLTTNETANVWNGQPLKVFMVEKGTMTEASNIVTKKDANGDETIEVDNLLKYLEFWAPVGTASGKIKMQVPATLPDGVDEDENVKYYPLTGSFDFFGWHMGEMAEEMTEGTDYEIDEEELTIVANKTIDGTQDIMAAKAALSNEQVVKLGGEEYASRAYSSWAARKDVQPVLTFQHLLSRLTFNVVAGEPKAAVDSYIEEDDDVKADGEKTFPKVEDEEGELIDQAVYITNIVIKDQKDDVVLTLSQGDTPITLTSEDTDLADFTLMQRIYPETGETDADDNPIYDTSLIELGDLVATAPQSYDQAAPVKTPVGESIMIFPGQEELTAEITVKQYVLVYEAQTEDEPNRYEWKEQTMTASIVPPKDAFAASESYAVNITIFGYQRIEVEAVLQGWTDGGSTDVNPEDQAFVNSDN